MHADSDDKLLAKSVAGAGGLVVLAGSIAHTSSDQSALAFIGDVDIAARNEISVSKTDKAGSQISIIPSISSDTAYVGLQQNNQVNIANTAKVEAGAGSNVTYKIEPLTFNGATRLAANRVGQLLTVAEKQSRQLPADTDFVFAPLTAGAISMTIQPGYVFHLVSGAFGGGTAGGYYAFLEGPQDVIPHQENYTSATRWRQLSQAEVDALATSESPVYESNATLSFAAGLANKYFIVKPADAAQPILSLRNVGNLLINQYDQVVSWIASHSGDAEAIARYEAQLMVIAAQLDDLGLLDSIQVGGRRIVKKGLEVLFIDLPALTASPGSIYIEQTGAAPNSFASKVSGGQLLAHADAKVDIANNSPFTMSSNGATMLDARRIATVGGKYLTLQPGNVYVNYTPLSHLPTSTVRPPRPSELYKMHLTHSAAMT